MTLGIGLNFTINKLIIMAKPTRAGFNEAVTTAGTTITFSTPLSDTNYALTVRCFDGSGNPVAVVITEKAATGFKATPAINSSLDYIAIIN